MVFKAAAVAWQSQSTLLDFSYKAMYYIYFGTVGWRGKPSLQALYPPDLPEDWMLSFYNTQFRCVYLPYDVWVNADDAEVRSWLRDTRDDFRFVLENKTPANSEDPLRAGRFGDRGVLESSVDLVWVEPGCDLRRLASRMQDAIETGRALYVVSRDGDLTLMRQIGELITVLGA